MRHPRRATQPLIMRVLPCSTASAAVVRRSVLTALVVVLSMFLRVTGAVAQGGVDGVAPPPIFDEQPIGEDPPASEIQPITDLVPLWGTTLRERGMDLPLPLGLGLTYTYLAQHTEVSNVKIEDALLNLDIPAAKTSSHTLVFRYDAWLLPILNVYGMLGYTDGQTEPTIRFRDGTTRSKIVNYTRGLYGGGATLAGGYKAFFVTLDANYTSGAVQSGKGQIGNHEIYSITVTPRAGMVFSSGSWGEGSLWIGGMYMDFEQEVRDTLRVAGRDIDFSVRINAKEPWNVLFGGNWELSKRWSIVAEVGGIFDRFQFTGAAMVRF